MKKNQKKRREKITGIKLAREEIRGKKQIITFLVFEFLVHDINIFRMIAVVIYIALGGLVFSGVESSEYSFSLSELEQLKHEVVMKFKNLSQPIIYKSFQDEGKIQSIKALLTSRAKLLIPNFDLLSEDRFVSWDTRIAMYYSFVQVTTIGYGDYVPSTNRGKLLTIIYASIGIPLCLSIFFQIGTVLTLSLYNCWLLFSYYVKLSIYQKVKLPEYKKQIMSINLLFLFLLNQIFLLLSALFLSQFSKLSYLESYYFFMITMSTIGFGDIYPSRSSKFLCIYLTCIGIGLTGAFTSNMRMFFQFRVESQLVIKMKRKFKENLALYLEEFEKEIVEGKIKNFSNYSIHTEIDEDIYVADFEKCHVM